MALTLGVALRLAPRSSARQRIDGGSGVSVAFAGAGGKTTCMQALARELPGPTLVTATTHMGSWQLDFADRHVVAESAGGLSGLGDQQVTIITGPVQADQRTAPVGSEVLAALRREALVHGWPLLIEADGARQKPLKGPRQDEPQIPAFVEIAVYVAGMAGLERRLDEASVHRASIFGAIAGIGMNSVITASAMGRVLADPRGGLKGIPRRARKVALLNQADTPRLQAEAQGIASALQGAYDEVLIATAQTNLVHAAIEPCAGIVLAAGGASRFGRTKQLLMWRGETLVHRAVRTAREAGLSPVVVVSGAEAQKVETAVSDTGAIVVRNTQWEAGQSSSIRMGLRALPPPVGSAVFLLADQPLVSTEVVKALADAHASESGAIFAPMIMGERRGNPVLFDRETFAHLSELAGDEGGRAIFPQYTLHYVPWHDERITEDIDTEADYQKLLEAGSE